jgi:hypothetical protein
VAGVPLDQVNAMVLNEFLKERRQVQDLKGIVAKQQKQIETLHGGAAKNQRPACTEQTGTAWGRFE